MIYGLATESDIPKASCIVIGLLQEQPLPRHAGALNAKTDGLISRLLARLESAGDCAWQSDSHGQSLLLINYGEEKDYTSTSMPKRLDEVASQLLKHRIVEAVLCLPQLAELTPDNQLKRMIVRLDDTCHPEFHLKSKEAPKQVLKTLMLFLPGATANALEQAVATVEGIRLTKHLANMPANQCTPSFLANEANVLARTFKTIRSNSLSQRDMAKLGMGALLAVAKGSHEPPQLIEMHYQGGGDTPPVALVGKGITFDSGGLSLKPADAMTEMKYDMCGGATVFGVMKACALLKLPINLIGLVPSAENMPSSTAVKPGDVVTSLSGQTVEIINTDAEGRLILADTLTYAERFNPDVVIDIATLTGAMVVALGSVFTGFMTDDDTLAKALVNASEASGDKAWRMPLDVAYQAALESPIADMLNATFDRSSGAITAACFLARFAEKYRWAHLDIAGTAWVSGKNRHATGRPVALLLQYLLNYAHQPS